MNRRNFFRLSVGGAVGLAAWSACRNVIEPVYVPGSATVRFPIEVQSDMAVGHLVMTGQQLPISEVISTETLIVGGGIAGLSAASALSGRDFLLCELSNQLGGSSAAHTIGGTRYTQGAHYDLSYPAWFGSEVAQHFESLGIVSWDGVSNQWRFNDKQYLIASANENKCLKDGLWTDDVLPNIPAGKNFIDLVNIHLGEMTLPTRLIDEKWRHLNHVTFADYLNKYLPPDGDLTARVNYQMLDDYGGTAEEVSALAGIHYYACRPYFQRGNEVELFSPPEGNEYFAQKLAQSAGLEQCWSGHLVMALRQSAGMVEADVLNIAENRRLLIRAKQAIYAGQKHALKYIFEPDAHLFSHNSYSAWVVINLEMKGSSPGPDIWQNDLVVADSSFLGFVNSAAQSVPSGKATVLTAYYCLPARYRHYLAEMDEHAKSFVAEAVDHISRYYDTDISGSVAKAYVKVMGHAMPLPSPGYLFNDRNAERAFPNVVYAGVDNGRLPLLYEAVDSGLEAVELIGRGRVGAGRV